MPNGLIWGPWRQVTRDNIPACPGCYAVYQNGELVYIGSSTNLSVRVPVYFKRHRALGDSNYGEPDVRPRFGTPWGFRHAGSAITVKVKVTRRIGDWLAREYRLIYRLQPRFNTYAVVRGRLPGFGGPRRA